MIFSAPTRLLENNFWVDVLDPKALGIRPRPKKGLFLPKLSSVWFEVEKSSQTFLLWHHSNRCFKKGFQASSFNHNETQLKSVFDRNVENVENVENVTDVASVVSVDCLHLCHRVKVLSLFEKTVRATHNRGLMPAISLDQYLLYKYC